MAFFLFIIIMKKQFNYEEFKNQKLEIGNYDKIPLKHKFIIFIIMSLYFVWVGFLIEHAPDKINQYNLPWDCIHNQMPIELKCIAIVILMFSICILSLVGAIKLIFKLCKI